MHSLFGRSKTSSSNIAQRAQPYINDFGELGETSTQRPPPLPKDKASKRSVSQLALNASAVDLPSTSDVGRAPPNLAEGSFFPTHITPKKPSSLPEYGYLSSDTDVFLGLDDVQRLVYIVDRELSTRGLTTPLLFSTKALDIHAARVNSLVQTFLATCNSVTGGHRHSHELELAEAQFATEAGFGGPHELGMLLKWALARVARVKGGFEVRGFLDLDDYLVWRAHEEELAFPPNHFPTIYDLIPPATHVILDTLLSLFSRLCAHSSSSGLTPSTLASHFGPLLFGLGPPSLPFGPTYSHYIRSLHAAEHMLLAYVRNSDHESAIGVELPTRLQHWIKGYPTMVPQDMERPRRDARIVPVASIRRNVRLYTPDLVQNATTWCGSGEHTSRKEWKRVVPSQHGDYSKPRYAEDYKKRLNLPKTLEPKPPHPIGALPVSAPPQTTNFSTSPPRAFRNPIDDILARSHPDYSSTSSLNTDTTNEDRFKNLADLQWTQFSEAGFKAPDTKLMQFDLGETARRNARNISKRETVSWSDFSELGFDRPIKSPRTPGSSGSNPLPLLPVDDPLHEVLQFSVAVENPSTWHEHSSDLTRKLRKQQKTLPTFGWETSPVAGRDYSIDEGMISTWSELCLSSGWTDRTEGTFREANWAFIEFKAIPEDPATQPLRNSSRDNTPDPRTSSQWFLIEEFVPREYRDNLQSPKKKPSLFASLNKPTKWKSASTLNGLPYEGRPRSPNPRDYEFDAMLRQSDSTTKLSLSLGPPGKGPQDNSRRKEPNANLSKSTSNLPRSPPVGFGEERPRTPRTPRPVESRKDRNPPPLNISAPLFVPPRNESKVHKLDQDAAPPPPPKTGVSLARFRVGKPAKTAPAEWDSTIEFETRTESDASDESPGAAGGAAAPKGRHARRQSKQDAWVDIVVVDPNDPEGSSNGHRSKADPDLAQAEIQAVFQGLADQRSFGEPPTPNEHHTLGDDKVLRYHGRKEDPVSIPFNHNPETLAPVIQLRPPTMVDPVFVDDEPLPVGEHGGALQISSEQSPVKPPRSVSPGPRIPLPASPHPPAKSPSTTSPTRILPPTPSAPSPTTTTTASTSQNGISNLIQMYQQKDDAVTTPPISIPSSPASGPRPSAIPRLLPPSPEELYPAAPLQRPSGIPISVKPQYGMQNPPRVESVNGGMSPARSPVRSMVADPPAPKKTPSPPGLTEPLVPPPPIPLLEPVRVPSPARYVHGAPLTNVLEDEEEE